MGAFCHETKEKVQEEVAGDEVEEVEEADQEAGVDINEEMPHFETLYQIYEFALGQLCREFTCVVNAHEMPSIDIALTIFSEDTGGFMNHENYDASFRIMEGGTRCLAFVKQFANISYVDRKV